MSNDRLLVAGINFIYKKKSNCPLCISDAIDEGQKHKARKRYEFSKKFDEAYDY